MKIKLQNRSGLSAAGLVVLGVVLFVCLIRFGEVVMGLKHFFSYFSTVALGVVIAYLINPLSVFFQKRVFFGIRKEKVRTAAGNAFAFVTVLFAMTLAALLVIPQLLESAVILAGNLEMYIANLEGLLQTLGMSGVGGELLNTESLIDSSVALLDTVKEYALANIETIVATSAGAGKSMVKVVIAFILSIYILAEKKNLKKGGKRLLQALLKDKYPEAERFLGRCNEILSSYIVYNLLDALIVGIANALFMTIMGMPYIGLISVVVGATNLIPNFGPVIGAVVGAFILVLVEPKHALFFLIFTLVLQLADGYVIKPKLFGESLGVSGLWILVGVLVGGQMFGVLGILLAIPVVAILDFIYHEYLLPALERVGVGGKEQEESLPGEAKTPIEEQKPEQK